jgi:hypothetical protein
VAIELDLARVSSADTTRLSVTCEAEVATLEVSDPVTGKSLRRRIDLASVPAAARARLVALAIVELVSASWYELLSDAEPVAPRVDATASEPTRRAAAEAVRRRALPAPARAFRLGISGAGRFGGRPAFVSPGLVVFGEHDLWGGLAAGLDLWGERATVGTSLGDVQISTLSAGLFVLARADLGAIAVEGGPGARLGVAWLEGLPSQNAGRGDSLVAPVAGAIVVARVLATVTPGLVVALGAEGGWTTRSVGALVGGVREVSLEGPWAGLSLGFGISFPRGEPVSGEDAT